MTPLTRLSWRLAALLTLSAAPMAAHAQYTGYRTGVDEMNEKLDMGLRFAHQMWSDISRTIRAPYGPPAVRAFRGSITTPCNPTEAMTRAFYCPSNNTIYYDEVWLYGEMRLSADAVGTDGDVGAIVVVLHEFGHAMHHMWQMSVRDVHQGPDMVADCFAGATLRAAHEEGHLDAGDLQEAEAALNRAGADGGRLREGQAASLGTHGPGWLRVRRFRVGYSSGVGTCMRMLENARS